VALNTFGRRLDLELSRNRNLLPLYRPLNLFFADAGGDSVNYVEDQVRIIGLSFTDASPPFAPWKIVYFLLRYKYSISS
jgi:hypothetical protein